MPAQKVTIKVNLSGLRGRLSRSLQRTMLLVAAGLQNLERINEDFLELPTDFQIQFDAGQKWTKDEVRINYSEWVLSNGFRDAIEIIGGILEEAHNVLSAWDLRDINKIALNVSNGQISFSDTGSFHQMGLPDKLRHLSASHKLYLDERLSSHLLRINAARNCLVHRYGIVKKRDFTTDSELQVTWRKMDLFLQDEDGEKPLKVGETVEKDGVIGIRFVDVCKSFALGDRVVFSVEEFAEICWSLFIFGEELIKKLSIIGIERGFLTPAQELPKNGALPTIG